MASQVVQGHRARGPPPQDLNANPAQWFSAGGDVAPQGTLDKPVGIGGCHSWSMLMV